MGPKKREGTVISNSALIGSETSDKSTSEKQQNKQSSVSRILPEKNASVDKPSCEVEEQDPKIRRYSQKIIHENDGKDAKDYEENETKDAKTESPNIRPEWFLMAVCFVAVAVLYVRMPSHNKLDLLERKLDLLERKLDNLISPHGKDFSEDIKALKEYLDDNYNSLEKNQTENTNNIEGLKEKVSGNSGLIDQFEIHKHDVSLIRISLDDSDRKLRDDMKSLDTKLEERLVEDMKFLNITLEERLVEESKKTSDLREKLGNVETEKAADADVKKLREEHDVRIRAMESQVDVSVKEITEKAKELDASMNAASANVKAYDGKIKEMKKKLLRNEEDIDTAFDNLFNKNVAVVVIVFILAMNFGLIVAVYTLCKGSQQPHGVRQKGPNGEYYNPVLDLIPVAPTLRKAIGVISFTREYQVGHRHLIRSVTDMMGGGHNIDIEYHVILKDEDISSIPVCSLIVICVEYSDRDVIIEEPGYGLGDCNKTTLASAQKIGAIPVIVYCKDLSSQRLQRNRLFNERIRCATHQKELIPLSENNRFFSVYDDFSADQNTAFQKLITDHVLR